MKLAVSSNLRVSGSVDVLSRLVSVCSASRSASGYC